MVNSLAVMSAKRALGKIPNYNSRYRVTPYVNIGTRRINLPNNYLRYAQEKVNKKLILNFKRKLRSGNENNYHGRGHFNTTMPGVYKNRNWKYFYYTTVFNPKRNFFNNYANAVIFYNTRNVNNNDPVFIHPITGKRKPVNFHKLLKNININNIKEGLRKRSKYNYWNRFTKKATRYLARK
jgi:hypothetical protein